ncbi:type IV secretion system protein [Stenotrophomonas sp.]|uniref:type IV secretion system protein n=1 Tax=Stenotrophomonas sp. TaxID=69392 RepID=UPI0028AF2F9C|nr:type IV secretion system protein [Stenotrophomonas sp.]
MNGFVDSAAFGLPLLADITPGNFLFFRLVSDYFDREIAEFGLELTRRAAHWVTFTAMTLTTFWVLLQGYALAAGRSQQSAMAIMGRAAKVALVLMAATAAGANGTALHKAVTDNLDKEIHQLFTGKRSGGAADAIDENLMYTQLALSALDAIHVDESDPELIEKKGRAMQLASFGTASPPMAAGAMLLLFKFTMAFLMGIGPIFILALMFEQTKDLFKKWLFYVLGTLFSMSLLSVVSAMVLKFTAKVAAAYWVVKLIPIDTGEGLSSQALQQGGIGLLMTALIITAPTIGAAMWQGNMAAFMAYSPFASPTPPPGTSGSPGLSPAPAPAPAATPAVAAQDALPMGAFAASPSPLPEATGLRGNAHHDSSRML